MAWKCRRSGVVQLLVYANSSRSGRDQSRLAVLARKMVTHMDIRRLAGIVACRWEVKVARQVDWFMDWHAFFSGGLGAATVVPAAGYLARKLIDQRLKKQLKESEIRIKAEVGEEYRRQAALYDAQVPQIKAALTSIY
jgi:hypothetical protein